MGSKVFICVVAWIVTCGYLHFFSKMSLDFKIPKAKYISETLNFFKKKSDFKNHPIFIYVSRDSKQLQLSVSIRQLGPVKPFQSPLPGTPSGGGEYQIRNAVFIHPWEHTNFDFNCLPPL